MRFWKSKKAMETYDKGLEKFPNSGILYLEKGNIHLINKEYEPYKNHYTKLVFKKDDIVADIMKFLR